MTPNKQWIAQAVNKIAADFNRSADTHMIKLDLPFTQDIALYLKDESTHPTGSLKHRLARSLYLYAICNGQITQNTTVIESSSGSTAISEAYFAKLLNLTFIAVIPKNTTQEKINQIKHYDGQVHLVEPTQIYNESKKLAKERNGHYMDQFTNAERATDWRGNNNIAESIFQQLEKEPHPIPTWIVASAGTGGTSATIGRYIRYTPKYTAKTKLCVVDPQNSVFYDYYKTNDKTLTSKKPSRIEGIGRPQIVASFIPTVIDKMMQIKDQDTIAAIHFLEAILNRKCGGSTGTNLIGAFKLIAQMHQKNQPGSVVTLICDSGERYLDCYYNQEYIQNQNLNIQPTIDQLHNFYQNGPSPQTPILSNIT